MTAAVRDSERELHCFNEVTRGALLYVRYCVYDSVALLTDFAVLVEVVLSVRPALLITCSALNLAKSNGGDLREFRALTFRYCELELTYLQFGHFIPFQV